MQNYVLALWTGHSHPTLFCCFCSHQGMHRGRDFPRWDDSQEVSLMFIQTEGSHRFATERFKQEIQRLGLLLNYLFPVRYQRDLVLKGNLVNVAEGEKKVYKGEERRKGLSLPHPPALRPLSCVTVRQSLFAPLNQSSADMCSSCLGRKREYTSYIHYHFTGRRMPLWVHAALRNRWVSSAILPKTSVILRRFFFFLLVELFICYPQFKEHLAIWSNL